MPEALVILDASIAAEDREAVLRAVPVTQSIAGRVFLTAANDATLARLPSMAGVALVLTGAEPAPSLPPLDEAASLFVGAWLSSRGQVKQRRGEGLDWDTPPMTPPDPKR
jgi:hypothetical protein